MIELSMSMLDTYQRCRRRWYYRYVLGLEPKGRPDYMLIGSGFHAGVAGGYREYASRRHFVEIAHKAFHEWLLTEDAAGFDMENAPLVEDMISFWWENSGKLQEYSEIVTVEEHLSLPLTDEFEIARNTPDLLARRTNGRLVLIDHKTVGSISETLAFLPMDFQLNEYALACWKKYGEIPEIDYNMVRRELPPNFARPDGTKPYSLTPTGRPSTRNADVDKYLRLERQVFTERKLRAFELELNHYIEDMHTTIRDERYLRSVVKTGASSCDLCPFFAPCKREFGGEALDGITLSLEFDRKPSILEPAA